MSRTTRTLWSARAALAVLGAGVAAISALTTIGSESAADTPRAAKDSEPPLIRSARSGAWSASSTWEGSRLPKAGDRVQIRAEHTVRYDVASDQAIRSVHVVGRLTFDPDRDTRLDVGLLKIQAGDDATENGFDCDAHVPTPKAGQAQPTLEVGTPEKPVAAGHTARIRSGP